LLQYIIHIEGEIFAPIYNSYRGENICPNPQFTQREKYLPQFIIHIEGRIFAPIYNSYRRGEYLSPIYNSYRREEYLAQFILLDNSYRGENICPQFILLDIHIEGNFPNLYGLFKNIGVIDLK
jgi:hypothetical protein